MKFIYSILAMVMALVADAQDNTSVFQRLPSNQKFVTEYAKERFLKVETGLNYWLERVRNNENIGDIFYTQHKHSVSAVSGNIDIAMISDKNIDVSAYRKELRFYENYAKKKTERDNFVRDSIAIVRKRIYDSTKVENDKAERLRDAERRLQEEISEQKEILIRDSLLSVQASKKDLQHKQYCIKKYGSKLGTLIHKGNIAIGYSKQMVKDAWGDNYYEDTYIKQGVTVDEWTYTSNRYVIFRNGKVYMIKK